MPSKKQNPKTAPRSNESATVKNKPSAHGHSSDPNITAIPSHSYQLFTKIFQPLSEETPSGRKDRTTAWKMADPNGNGMLSLAEVDSWIQGALMSKHQQTKGTQLYKLFRPVYIRAFDAARDIAAAVDVVGGSVDTDSYVTKTEFRLLNAYLCIFAEMFDAFTVIDGGGAGVDANDDRRISLEEWKNGHKMVTPYNLVALKAKRGSGVMDPETVFHEMDADGKGMVLLAEWIDYLARAEIDAKTGKGIALGKANAFKGG